jgi:hypothetical protein
MQDWLEISDVVEKVEWCEPFEKEVMNIQIWPFSPSKFDGFSMGVAVALSFTPAELMAESRISLAVDELLGKWGYHADGL